MTILAVRLPRRSIVLRLKHLVFRVLRSSFWSDAFSIRFSEEKTMKIAGLKHRCDLFRGMALLLGAEVTDATASLGHLHPSSIWFLHYRGATSSANSELEILEWFLAELGVHPDDPNTRRILHDDGRIVWG